MTANLTLEDMKSIASALSESCENTRMLIDRLNGQIKIEDHLAELENHAYLLGKITAIIDSQ